MEQSLQNIIESKYKFRLEFNFNNFYINFQGNDKNGITIFSNYEKVMMYKDNRYYIQRIYNANDIIKIFVKLPKDKWKRIKIKFYGMNINIDEANKLKKLLKEFCREWKNITNELGCKLEWDVNDGLFYYFANEWNNNLI